MADSTFAIESDQEHLLNIDTILQQKRLQLILKRIFDIVVSFVGLVILSPLFLILAIAIARDSKGPVFFKQTRVGRNEVPFKIYKFRTMVEDAEARGMQLTVGDDSRITKVGTFLRKTKIDELPQLINVFKGEMSFVGPRPEVPKYVGLYTEDQSVFCKRKFPIFAKIFPQAPVGNFFVNLTVSSVIASCDSFVHQRLTNNNDVSIDLLLPLSFAHHKKHSSID